MSWIWQGRQLASASKDGKNQLTRHDSVTQGKSFKYYYDAAGNITSKKEYAYATGNLDETTATTVSYTYGDESWGDLLTSLTVSDADGNTTDYGIAYDTIGNPTSYLGWSFDWTGRSLTGATKDSQTLSFTYNSDGIRTSKTVNGTKTEYLLNGTQILAQKTGSNTLCFFYDQQGNRVGMADSSNHIYYYLYNLQGDVIALADASTGKLAATYTYDAWGKIVKINGMDPEEVAESSIAKINPFRYRGYYYDHETGFYYLNSRYYNPEVGRFINEDAYFSFDNLLGYNLFAYCYNNPVNYYDPMGKNAAAAATWTTTMYWLTMVDGPAIVGDAIFAIGLVVCGIIIVDAADNSPPANSKSSSKPSSKTNGDDPTNVDDKDTTPQKPSTPSRGDTPRVKYPGNDGSKSPGENYEWRGPEPVGGDKGAWVNRRTGESLHPDLNHGAPMGPHWDYKDIFRVFWRLFPDGRILPK